MAVNAIHHISIIVIISPAHPGKGINSGFVIAEAFFLRTYVGFRELE